MILLPTLNRTKYLAQFIESYRNTGASVPVKILVDQQDLTDNETGYRRLDLPAQMTIVDTGRNVTMGDKCRFIFPHLGEIKWVGLLNDDHVCRTEEWDKKAESLLNGKNMVSTNDGYWNFGFNVVGLTAWSMPLLEAAGFPIFPGKLNHYFIDNLWKNIGETTGSWLETIKINIEHRHVFLGKMDPDDTFRKVNDPQKTAYDKAEFDHFMKQDFQGVCERILKLRGEEVHKEKFT